MKTESDPSAATKLEWRDPAELRLHAARKRIHELPEDAPAFRRIVASMEQIGYDASEPIVIDPQNRIMEGGNRWRAARRLQIERVAVVVRPEAELAGIIIRSICARKHYSKSAIAFECYPFFEEAHNVAVEADLENLKKGRISPDATQWRPGVHSCKNVENLAQEMGVGREIFKMAARVHKLFAEQPDYAAQMKPRLYCEFEGGEHENTRPVGLGAIISGFATWQVADKAGRFAPGKHDQLELFGKAVKSFVFQAGRLTAEGARDVVRKQLSQVEPEELERIAIMADLVQSEARRAIKHTTSG